MRYKYLILFAILFFVTCTPFAQKSKYVILKGVAINFNNQIQVADFSELANFSLPNLERTFVPDSAGRFFTAFKIDKQNYFKVGRNVLFLSPGDSLDIRIDYEYAEKATFRGRGSEANTYLKNTSFPKGGSFIKSGEEIKNNFENTLKNIFSIAKQRENELLSYKNITNEFKKLELGRIKADIINSLWDLRYYYRDVIKNGSADLFKEEYQRKAIPLIEEYSAGFYRAELLNLEVYRDILHIIDKNSSKILKSGNNQERVHDWMYANMIANKLKSVAIKDSIRALKSSIDKITNISYKALLKKIYMERMAFGNGDSAKSFIAYNENNEKVSLNDFQGTVIYLDIWATWCGPCLSEMPHFDKLKEKYKDNNIVFISLSIDSDIGRWKKFLQSRNLSGNYWVIDRLKLSDYSVIGVPRTIIIDKNFKVFDIYGPSPSSKRTEEIIEELLK